MIKRLMIVCAVLCGSLAYGQISYGKITYERKTNLYKKFKDNGDVKEWLREEDKNKVDLFELYFNDTLSIFKPQESELVERMSWATSKNTVYQDYRKQTRLTEKDVWGEKFLITDSVRHFTWKITDSKRKICGYMCRKAIWTANDSTRLYAWYSNEIMPSIGPESFVGLPGTILGLATEDGGVIYFAKTVEIVKQDAAALTLKKSKLKLYTADQVIAIMEKQWGKEKWFKTVIHNNFGIW
jgi:GLPGLI family protein